MSVHVGFQVGWRDGDKALDNWEGPATHSVRYVGMYRTFVGFRSRTVTGRRGREMSARVEDRRTRRGRTVVAGTAALFSLRWGRSLQVGT
jgi:hypothetical protein